MLDLTEENKILKQDKEERTHHSEFEIRTLKDANDRYWVQIAELERDFKFSKKELTAAINHINLIEQAVSQRDDKIQELSIENSCLRELLDRESRKEIRSDHTEALLDSNEKTKRATVYSSLKSKQFNLVINKE